jgi:hypothetical protein
MVGVSETLLPGFTLSVKISQSRFMSDVESSKFIKVAYHISQADSRMDAVRSEHGKKRAV